MKIFIELENNSQLSYFAGSTIFGNILLDISNPNGIKSSGLKIKCTGEAKVKWGEKSGKHTIYRTDNEVYFFFKTYLIGSHDGPEIPIQSGLSRIPFAFVLPTNIPSSFMSKRGRIEYYLQATLKRSWKFDAETRLNFSVNGIVDLNTIPSPIPNIRSIEQPFVYENEEDPSFLCWNSRPFSFQLTINQLGFVPGQTVSFDLTVNNLSNLRIRSVSVSVYQGISYTAQNRHNKLDKILLSKMRFGQVGGGQEQYWKNVEFKLPSLPPTGLGGGCRLIDIKYWLEIRASSFMSKLNGSLPFIIGNIPLARRQVEPTITYDSSGQVYGIMSVRDTSSTTTTTTNTTSGSILDGYPNLTLPSYEEVAGHCPSYEEAKAITEEQHVYMQNKDFKPRYAVYEYF